MPHSKNSEPKFIHPRFFRCSLILNDQVMKFDPHQSIECNPTKAIGLNSYFLNMRHELYNLSRLSIETRREKLKKVLIQDFLREEREMAEVDLGYINTQP